MDGCGYQLSFLCVYMLCAPTRVKCLQDLDVNSTWKPCDVGTDWYVVEKCFLTIQTQKSFLSRGLELLANHIQFRYRVENYQGYESITVLRICY